MIIDYSKPYHPSGLNAPVEGDYVLLHWEAPRWRTESTKTTWVVRRFGILQSSIYADTVKIKGYFDLPKERIVRVFQWDGVMPSGIKSW